MSKDRRYVCGHLLPAAEADILELLLAANAPLTVPEIQERLPESRWAHTTISTLLSRLGERGLVRREPRGRLYEWSPAGTEQELAVAALEQVLEGVEDPDAVVMGFLDSLRRRKQRTR